MLLLSYHSGFALFRAVGVRVKITRFEIFAVKIRHYLGINDAVYFATVRRLKDILSVLFFISLTYHFYYNVLGALLIEDHTLETAKRRKKQHGIIIVLFFRINKLDYAYGKIDFGLLGQKTESIGN